MTVEQDLKEAEKKGKWLKQLAGFIVEANRNTWAADAPEAAPQRPDHHELSYQKSDWELRDSYCGYFRAPGTTVVYYKGKAVWTMFYFGPGMTKGKEGDAKRIFNNVLKPALIQVPEDLPLRGPKRFEKDGCLYSFTLLRGNLEDFLAEEEITEGDETMFAQTIGGGIIIHKDKNRQPVHPWNL